MSLFGLVDCNNFFVSCERLFRPDLIGHPTVVLGSNDGVIVSRSEEAKKLGIPMGVPQFKVRDIFKEHKVAAFSSNFELYRDVSDRVMAVLEEEWDEVFQYSIDEAFFKLPGTPRSAKGKLAKLKAVVERKVGVPVSLGAGHTMTVAKLASELEKRKSGVAVLTGKKWQGATKEIELREIWGIGGNTAVKMREHSLLTVADLLNAPKEYIVKHFGVHGQRLQSELSEIPAHDPGDHQVMQKSIMSTRSFSKTTTVLAELEAAVTFHVERAAEELREIGGRTSELRVILQTSRHGDWLLQSGSDSVVLSSPASDTRVLLRQALKLARQIYRKDVPYKKAGVVLSRIDGGEVSQFRLWQEEEVDDKEFMSVVDGLNTKWGRDALTFGRVKSGGRLEQNNHSSFCYTTNWNEIKKISAQN